MGEAVSIQDRQKESVYDTLRGRGARLLWRSERWLVFTAIFTVPVTVALSALALYTPTLVLRALERSERFSAVALVILGLLLTKLLFDLVNNILNVSIHNSEIYVLERLALMQEESSRDRDWYLGLDPEIQKLDERAEAAMSNNHTPGVHFHMDFAEMTASVLNFALFGTVISTLSPWVILLLALGAVLDYGVGVWERRRNYAEKGVRDALQKKLFYFWDLSDDFKYAKDIRLYSMSGGLHRRFMSVMGESTDAQKRLEGRKLLHALTTFLVAAVRDGAAYAFHIQGRFG